MRVDQIVQIRVKNSLIGPVQSKAHLNSAMLILLATLLFEYLRIWVFENWGIGVFEYWSIWVFENWGEEFRTSKEKSMVIKPPPINTGPEKKIILLKNHKQFTKVLSKNIKEL